IEKEPPDFVVPAIEAIATDRLVELDKQGQKVVPRARAARLTMDREGIRRLAAEELQLPTSAYRFAASYAAFCAAAEAIGFPCIINPVLSPSGTGKGVFREAAQMATAWDSA
ncbi:ATP-grasp domain-containing protein, partial [Erwinia amylovora]|uniref:ATP-binding protein n=1 Tax=Erwinia amylovora TaxID=552 RepID=UPI000FE363DC